MPSSLAEQSSAASTRSATIVLMKFWTWVSL